MILKLRGCSFKLRHVPVIEKLPRKKHNKFTGILTNFFLFPRKVRKIYRNQKASRHTFVAISGKSPKNQRTPPSTTCKVRKIYRNQQASRHTLHCNVQKMHQESEKHRPQPHVKSGKSSPRAPKSTTTQPPSTTRNSIF